MVPTLARLGGMEENGRYPDVIVELMSPTTAEIDTGAKKELYEQVLERDYLF